MHAHNPGFTLTISLKVATIKAKSYIKVILVGFFLKKSYSGQLGHFGPKNATLHYYNSGSAINIFLILHNQRGEEVHQNYMIGFSKKDLIQGNLVILGQKKMCHHNSGSTQTIF